MTDSVLLSDDCQLIGLIHTCSISGACAGSASAVVSTED